MEAICLAFHHLYCGRQSNNGARVGGLLTFWGPWTSYRLIKMSLLFAVNCAFDSCTQLANVNFFIWPTYHQLRVFSMSFISCWEIEWQFINLIWFYSIIEWFITTSSKPCVPQACAWAQLVSVLDGRLRALPGWLEFVRLCSINAEFCTTEFSILGSWCGLNVT